MAKYTTFDNSKDEPIPLSRTGIDEFIRCSRTFNLKRKYGVKFPSISIGLYRPQIAFEPMSFDHLIKAMLWTARKIQARLIAAAY